MSNMYEDTANTAATAMEQRQLEDKAASWTPAAQAEYANFQRMQTEGIKLSPNMHMALGYLDRAKSAYQQINGK
ncbi:hypothetical protein [Arthrobacter sp. 4R501]|uniref:hypothetical protein n=1 Tax=Arthrobacter sp. 4R501 TaxID=2058886 RepID=UPI000CE4C6C0|nr:hypothetical protein [Arthrobacter sp. 4R501]